MKPNIYDFRSHRMAQGGRTGMYNFRKMYSETAEKSEYTSIVKTREELDREAAQEDMEEDSESEEEVEQQKSKRTAESKKYSVEDIMELASKLSINKKKMGAAAKEDVPMDSQSKGIKKKKHWKKSQRIIKFK